MSLSLEQALNSEKVRKPEFDPNELKPGILHIGFGQFHRAHQAVYVQKSLNKNFEDTGIVGLNLRSRTNSDKLRAQNSLYTVTEYDDQGLSTELIASVKDAWSLDGERDKVFDFFASESLKVVTLTVTEKGYSFNESIQSLDIENELIQSDLKTPENPNSTIGVLALGIKQRSSLNQPLSLISCDNLSGNGNKLRTSLKAYLAQAFPECVDWFEDNVSTPNTMVDRIVPGLSDERLKRLQAEIQIYDELAVETEVFTQWVVEDDFRGYRPKWDDVGVEFVKDVEPYENMKLRLLNASHSLLAYLGPVLGYKTVDEAIGDKEVLSLVRNLMFDEALPVLGGLGSFDFTNYCESLLKRFRNPNLKHQLLQIAMDGSIKVQQRWLPTLEQRAASNEVCESLKTAVAAWLAFWWLGLSEQRWQVSDPMSGNFEDLYKKSSNSQNDFCARMLDQKEIFASELYANTNFRSEILSKVNELVERGKQ